VADPCGKVHAAACEPALHCAPGMLGSELVLQWSILGRDHPAGRSASDRICTISNAASRLCNIFGDEVRHQYIDDIYVNRGSQVPASLVLCPTVRPEASLRRHNRTSPSTERVCYLRAVLWSARKVSLATHKKGTRLPAYRLVVRTYSISSNMPHTNKAAPCCTCHIRGSGKTAGT
jgi:hypothetical protein